MRCEIFGLLILDFTDVSQYIIHEATSALEPEKPSMIQLLFRGAQFFCLSVGLSDLVVCTCLCLYSSSRTGGKQPQRWQSYWRHIWNTRVPDVSPRACENCWFPIFPLSGCVTPFCFVFSCVVFFTKIMAVLAQISDLNVMFSLMRLEGRETGV